MPENKQERQLPGETSVTPSSDDAIKEVLEGLRGEITGLSHPEIVVDGETLKPFKSVADAENKDILKPINISRISSKLDHIDSRSGLLILRRKLERKAA